MSERLRQTSTVTVSDRELEVTSEVLLHPELLVVTTVSAGRQCLRRSHLPLSPQASDDLSLRGEEGLLPHLQAIHLRFVGSMLSITPERPEARLPPPPPGVVGTVVLGPAGERLAAAGDDVVPGPWLSSGLLVVGLGETIGAALSLGDLEEALLESRGLSAVVRRAGDETRVCFVSPSVAAENRAVIDRYLESIA